jgi:predicted transcriptional regulator
MSFMLGAFVMLLKLLPFVLGKIDDLLENANRSSIYSFIDENPGSTIARVSQARQIDRATVKYHLYKLENEGKIVLRKIGKYSRAFRNSGTYSDREQTVISHLQNGNSRTVLMLIMGQPGITNQELADRIGVKKNAVSWHIDRFTGDGLVYYIRDGKFKRYYVTDYIVPMLRQHAESAAS